MRPLIEGFIKVARRLSADASKAKSLEYSEFGNPRDVVLMKNNSIPKLPDNQLLLRTLATPVNPADLNMIQGTYGIHPSLPAVGGNEGVFEVFDVGSMITKFRPGDWVIPAFAGSGTWSSYKLTGEDDVLKVDKRLDVVVAATLLVNPATAYRMIKDFAKLNEGDWIIQNGATSSVGRFVIQLAKLWNMKTANIIRNRPDVDIVKQSLCSLGADLVITDDELSKAETKSTLSNIRPRLGLNCVGGRSVMYIANAMHQNGTIVSYGGMSKQPVQVGVGPLIFKDIHLHGFWMSRWYKEASETDKLTMLSELSDLFITGALQSPQVEKRPFKEYQDVLDAAMDSTKKQILMWNTL